MMQSYSVEAVLKATDKGFTKAFGKAEKSVDNVGRNVPDVNKKTGSLMGSMKTLGGVIAGAFVLDQIVQFGTQLVTATAAVEAMHAQFGQVFGD